MSARLRLVIVSVALLIGVALVTPTEAQSRFWVLVNGALRYNAQVQVGMGTAAAPGVAFVGDPTSGLYDIAAGNTAFSSSGVGRWLVTGTTFQLKSDQVFGWSSGAINSATDTALTRAGVGQFGWTAVLFANLGTPSNGSFCYCSDCTIANPCASGGSGALAKRLNGAWVCN